VTQPYGVANSRYPATGHHIGTDYAAPSGTPVLAPAGGRVIASSSAGALGNCLTIEYEHGRQVFQSRLAHLSTFRRTIGAISAGEVLAYTGNTGDSTGPHLHVDVWPGGVNLIGINGANFRQRTIDPELHYQNN